MSSWLARTSSVILNRSVESGHPCFVLKLMENTFSLIASKYDVCCRFFLRFFFICLKKFPFIWSLLRVLSWMSVEFWQMLYLYKHDQVYFGLYYINMMYCINFEKLNQPGIPKINPTGSFLYVTGFDFCVYAHVVYCHIFGLNERGSGSISRASR